MFAADARHRTIHGMVYNAMKLFMEINPQLFDECSDHYRESEATAAATLQSRKDKWSIVVDRARRNSSSGNSAAIANAISPPLTDRTGHKFDPATIGGKINEADEPVTVQDSQQRLDALRLQDESGAAAAAAGGSRSGKPSTASRDPAAEIRQRIERNGAADQAMGSAPKTRQEMLGGVPKAG